MRGQSSVEYAAVMTLMLLILVPIIYLGMSSVEDAGRLSQAKVAVDTMVKAANIVYAQGPGARTVVDVYMPMAIDEAKSGFYGREVRVTIYKTNGAQQDVFAMAKGNVTGDMPTTPGLHRLYFEMYADGVVRVREGG